ncbi:MAG TPA: DUF3566 domain-containing protein [Mycobacterium sp.]|nr:DUF3566 domain-containing protein [Mycobacterium sp.]
MTAPNEPGNPGPDGGPGNGDGSTQRVGQHAAPAPAVGRGAEFGEATSPEPPKKRAPARRPQATAPRPTEQPRHQEPPPAAQAPGVPGLDAQLRRFVPGTAAAGAQPGQAAPAADDLGATRIDSQPVETYGTELPDLSDPPPPVQRQPAIPRMQVGARARGPVRASMQVRRIDPWSTLKVSLLLSVALFFVWMIAVAVLYLMLGAMGVWSKLNSNMGDLLTNTTGAADLVSASSIFGGAFLIGLVNIVLLTAMATLGAVIYNVSTDVVGGIEVTLADRD